MELKLGKNRVRRVMKLYHVKPYKRKARWRKRRDYDKPEAPYPNLIKGSCPIKPEIIMVGDFTRIEYGEGVIYLATYMDLFTREIVGWSISTSHTAELVINALFDTIKTLGRIPKIIHTDQGSEYNCKEYLDLLRKLNIRISMSKKASPWENAYQESFYDNFKTDLGLEFDRFPGIGELAEAIHQTINYYNKQRIHTKFKMSPAKFKSKFLNLPV
jgi:transposase InsO family protein